MRGVIKKWGNSAAIRLPAPLLKSLQLGFEDAIEIRVEEGRIILEPIRVKDYTLGALLSAVRPETVHEEVDYGTPGI